MNKTKYFLFLSVAAFMLSGSFSSLPIAHALGNQVTLEDLGVLQLAAHDLFNVDRMNGIPGTGVDNENGLLDLSTLLDHGHSNIAMGGEFRNAENIMIFTISSELGAMYLNLEQSVGPQLAREQTLEAYHNMVKQSYLNAFDEQVPNAIFGCVTMTENLAFRTVHDFLPQEIQIGDPPITISIFDLSLFGQTLTIPERMALSSPLDGTFDPDFTIDIFIPPPVSKTVNLFQADSSFAVQFFTDFTFEFFLSELNDGFYNPDEDVMKQIRSLIAKGLGDGCYVGGETIQIETTSLILAGVQSFSWMIPVVLSVLGIGLFVVSRKSENS
jgi:hypothetical protein